ncbi:MAG TPA: hypothetical protein VM557_14800 [Thermoanaerobaculia bacterium]|nr:hypothetical protein [Thermoanaerobaculia bacterium]
MKASLEITMIGTFRAMRCSRRVILSVLVLLLAAALPLAAQRTPPPPGPPPTSEEEDVVIVVPGPDSEAEPDEDISRERATSETGAIDPSRVPPTPEAVEAARVTVVPETERRDGLPDANIYLPEGELDIKVRRLIRNSLFEGQVNYNFVDGDVSTFLRYKYYARNFSYKLSVFDELEFAQLGGSTQEFDRTRGGLLLFRYPHNYDQRYTLLTQVDSLAYGDVTRPDNDKTNVYVKLGYQFGTETDERLNSLVGETRGRIIPVLTAYRDVGPRQMGLAAALTASLDAFGSEFDYIKFESELLKRYDFNNNSVLFGRAHLGSLLQKTRFTDDPLIPDFQEFSVPRYELFKLGGRDLMKGVDGSERGTDEFHVTGEYLTPVFQNRDYRRIGARFNDLFGIAYAGVGSLTYGTGDLVNPENWVVDVGLGFELAFGVRNYEIILTALYAMPVVAPDSIDGGEFRVAARTAR